MSFRRSKPDTYRKSPESLYQLDAIGREMVDNVHSDATYVIGAIQPARQSRRQSYKGPKHVIITRTCKYATLPKEMTELSGGEGETSGA
jgi:hypothetical protein